jgi:hypothetical protein
MNGAIPPPPILLHGVVLSLKKSTGTLPYTIKYVEIFGMHNTEILQDDELLNV